MFKEYQSKPITRKAYQIKNFNELSEVDNCTARLKVGLVSVDFKFYEPVKVGDYVVFLNESDVYHCSESVFVERNIVE